MMIILTVCEFLRVYEAARYSVGRERWGQRKIRQSMELEHHGGKIVEFFAIMGLLSQHPAAQTHLLRISSSKIESSLSLGDAPCSTSSSYRERKYPVLFCIAIDGPVEGVV